MKLFRRLLYKLLAAVVLVLLVVYLRSDVRPLSWTPPPLPELNGEFAPGKNTRFPSFELIRLHAPGPEDVAMDNEGRLVTGLSDGSIVRIGAAPDRTQETLVNTGGRPLGLQFDAANNLIIADAYKGLLLLTPEGELRVLTDSVNGKRLNFVDDLDIASDGTVWFSDASQRFGLDAFMKDILEASATGRLLSYSPLTGKTTVHMDNIYFANGVALGPDERYVLVNETGSGRILRLWLKDEQRDTAISRARAGVSGHEPPPRTAGQQDVFYNGLPGHPDNVSFNHDGTFWVALPALRDRARERAAGALTLRRLLGGLPAERLHIDSQVGFVLGLDVNGQVQHMRFRCPSEVAAITSVNQHGSSLVLGSLRSDQILVMPAPAPQ